MHKLTPEQIELGLTDKDTLVRKEFAERRDYTPTPAQMERGMKDPHRFVRMLFAQRMDGMH